ncbi:MAG: asparagine synthase-related protein, partial [Burkholderiaceae bacterium]
LFAGYWDRTYRFALMQARAEGDEAWIVASLRANADNTKAMIAARAVLDDATLLAHGIGLVQPEGEPASVCRFLQPSVLRAPVKDALAGFQGSLGDALVCDAAAGRLPEWLWQNDRNAMASGIENRSPLLDHRLAPWMHSAMRNKFSGPWNKLELRELFSIFQPLPTQWRRDKQGFRWVYNRFLHANRSAVLELVASSRLLPDRVDVSPLLDAARHDDAVLECGLLQRMLCIAGLEETMGLVAQAGV